MLKIATNAKSKDDFMKLKAQNLPLYAITDRRWLKNMSLSEAVRLAIEGGAGLIQLREKNLPYDELRALALDVHSITSQYSVPLIINDDVELCADIDAEGVHVGAEDMSVTKAREILGNNKIIGATARTLERAVRAYNEGADYLGIGAVFDTSTKDGTTRMTRELAGSIISAVDIPAFAIGGISRDNILSLSGYGISGVAVVSAVFASDDIKGVCKELKALAEKVVKAGIYNEKKIDE